jgi:hypothetical protein
MVLETGSPALAILHRSHHCGCAVFDLSIERNELKPACKVRFAEACVVRAFGEGMRRLNGVN